MKLIKNVIFNNQNHGFTIIELVVVIAILTLISVSSFVGFNKYNNTLKLNSEAENLKTNINEAKSSALSGFIYKCTASQSLYGYKLSIDSASTYSLYEVCIDNGTGVKISNQLINKKFNLQTGLTFNPTGVSVTFLAVSGIPESSAVFKLVNGSSSSSVSVDSSGIIK